MFLSQSVLIEDANVFYQMTSEDASLARSNFAFLRQVDAGDLALPDRNRCFLVEVFVTQGYSYFFSLKLL